MTKKKLPPPNPNMTLHRTLKIKYLFYLPKLRVTWFWIFFFPFLHFSFFLLHLHYLYFADAFSSFFLSYLLHSTTFQSYLPHWLLPSNPLPDPSSRPTISTPVTFQCCQPHLIANPVVSRSFPQTTLPLFPHHFQVYI